jgi:hypothetical protein
MSKSKIEIIQSLSGADLSLCGQYRYRLGRRWTRQGISKGLLVYLMLNPSTADATTDDPTIRKCIGFADRLGYDGIQVINLFSLRSTDPSVLVERVDNRGDLLGPDYDHFLNLTVRHARTVVAAWGCADTLRRRASLAARPAQALARIREINPEIEIMCLGRSKDGSPRHPLMLAYTTQLEPFEVPHV